MKFAIAVMRVLRRAVEMAGCPEGHGVEGVDGVEAAVEEDEDTVHNANLTPGSYQGEPVWLTKIQQWRFGI